MHTKKVHLFQEVTGVEQALIKKIVATIEEVYLSDICNQMTNPITLNQLQDNYSQ